MSEPHDNDADSRPRIYKRATSKHGEVEVEVVGGEGESSEDIEDTATEQFSDAAKTQKDLRTRDEEPSGKGCR
jgi:hypothetical protein